MQTADKSWRLGVDVGGTFTDVVLHARDGRTTVRKLLSTPPDYERAVVRGVEELAGEQGIAGAIDEIIHGTTVATNAVLERRGSRTALVTTAGFRDVLELRRLRIPHMYDLFWRKPPPLVPRHLRFELDERVLADGTVERPFDEDEAVELAARLEAAAVESVAVCFLHSYVYPAHEELLGAVLHSRLPGVSISLSSEILREQREYERSAMTAVNAYVRPVMARYLDRIGSGLEERGLHAPLLVMQSSGGVMTTADARTRPVFALESGPAAGVVAAAALANRLGFPNVISLDMGGTTAKASLIERGVVSRAREYEVGGSLSAGSRLLRGSGELIRIPTIDIAEIGAGGGSVAWVDAAGGLEVGPRSAGANPGPACYGRGGTEPTVTDANVVLGLMPSAPVADGQISVSAELAHRAVQGVGDLLDLAPEAAAQGIHALANARMTRALRSVSSEKGRDPREFALLAYGGAGPLHAVGLAEELGCTTVLVPVLAGLFSSLGLLFARPELHEVRMCRLDPRSADPSVVGEIYERLEERARSSLGQRPVSRWVRTADLRYCGQGWEIEVPFEGSLENLVECFEDEHERLYGVRGQPDSPIELRALRLAALGPAPAETSLRIEDTVHETREPARQVHFAGGELSVPILARASITPHPKNGPLLVDEYDTTVVVPPGWSCRLDAATQTLILERERT